MGEYQKIAWTAVATVLGGTAVIVFGQLVSRFLIEPWYDQRKVRGFIAESLLSYTDVFWHSEADAHPRAKNAADHLRSLSAELTARTMAVPGYHVLSVFGRPPRFEQISKASRNLVALSNALPTKDWRTKLSLAYEVAVNLGFQGVLPWMPSAEAVSNGQDGS